MVREVAPLMERMRDYGILAGTLGGCLRAIHTARHDVPIILSAIWSSGTCAALAATFIGLRHVILQGRWQEDREMISGLALGVVGGGYAIPWMSTRAAGHVALGCFLGGCVAHYAHRWWLHYRLAWNMGWRIGDGWFE